MIVMGFFALLGVVGVAVALRGWRGRRVGGEQRCGGCGFDLRGRPEGSGRCAECGADLERAGAVVTGVRRRRVGWVVSGVVMVLVSVGMLGVGGWRWAREYNWVQWEPNGWLLRGLDSADGARVTAAQNELVARVGRGSYPQGKVDELVDAVLARQGDRAKAWGAGWGAVIDEALAAGRVDDGRLDRYVRQGMRAELHIKRRLRQGQKMQVGVEFRADRYGSETRLRGKWGAERLYVGSVAVSGKFIDAHEREVLGSSHYRKSVGGDWLDWEAIGLGERQVEAVVKVEARVTEPEGKRGPVGVEIPVRAPVEFVAAGEVVDRFEADPALRERVRGAVAEARVGRDEKGMVDVRFKMETPPPVGLAMAAVLVQGGREQRVGTVRLDAGERPRWVRVWTREKPVLSGVVDLHLRPDQEAADSVEELRTYWGEEVVVRGIAVDAAYEAKFIRDESLRAGVERAIKRPEVWREGKGAHALRVHLHSYQSPVKLAYRVVLSAGGREVVLDEAWVVGKGENSGTTTHSRDVDSAGRVGEVDVILRPDRDWEVHSFDLDVPWGGEVVFRGVKVGGGE